MKVGILGFQGCIEPHRYLLSKLGVESSLVRSVEELSVCSHLILPGGESTTMLKFLISAQLIEPIKTFASKKPVWGICAGSILIAKEVAPHKQLSLGLIDIRAERNFYGSQLDSFESMIQLSLLDTPILARFIRAPLLRALETSQNSEPLEVLATHNNQEIFFRQGHIWACSCHIELGEDTRVHGKFIEQ